MLKKRQRRFNFLFEPIDFDCGNLNSDVKIYFPMYLSSLTDMTEKKKGLTYTADILRKDLNPESFQLCPTTNQEGVASLWTEN